MVTTRVDWRRADGRLILFAVMAQVILTSPGLSASGTAATTPAEVLTGVLHYDIPAQPLARALEAYSKVNGLQVLYDSALAVGRRSSPVADDLTAAAALRRMLEGSGLGVLYTESRDVVILPIEELEAANLDAVEEVPVLELDPLYVEGAPELGRSEDDRRRLRAYSQLIQADLRRFLAEHGSTGSKGYNIGLDVWIDERGRISRTHVFRSSGDLVHDQVVASILVGFALRAPPPGNMPQPANVIIAVKPL
jgi:hypothetical protein